MKKFISILGIILLFGIFVTGCEGDMPWDGWFDDEMENEVDGDEDAEDSDEDEEPADVDSDELITFLPEPILKDYTEFFAGEKLDVMENLFGPEYFATDDWTTPDVYELGTFNSGDYAGKKLHLAVIPCVGPCFDVPFYRFVVNSDKTWTAFTRYSDTWDEWYTETAGDLFNNWDNVIIDQYEYPDVITDSETGTVFEKVEDSPNEMIADYSKYKIFTDDEAGPVYIERNAQCIVTSLPDGTSQMYDMLVDFSTGMTNNIETEYVGSSSGELFDITWDDGTKEDGYYSYKGPFGIGQCFYDRSAEYSLTNTMEQTGTNSEGDPIYTFKYDDFYPLQDFYEMAFPEYMDDVEKLPYDEFLAKRPLFYWVDPYERLIEFGRSEYQPVAEIGKPVIYLYPEGTSLVHVEVEPTHGISVSDPEYGRDGWTVLAKTDGSLLNLADREFYPYLFWEGLSLDYKMPEEGFVVAHRDVEEFLKGMLAELGLIDNEIADFMEFWYPKFNSAPYYFVTFMPQEDFEKIAPLSVTPAPDTVIRVYMDFVPLKRPLEVHEPEIVTPERDGFAVVEWGGALHR